MKRYIVSTFVALLLVFGLVGQASAHAKLVSSTPAAGARLTAAPATVTLAFTEEISEKDSSFTVADEKGATVGTGKLDLNDLDHKTLVGSLKSGLANGVYSVAWKTVTPDDNGVSEGTFTFGVNADPGTQPTAAPDNDEDEATATAAPTATAATSAPTAKPSSTTAASAPAATATTGGATALPATGGDNTPLVMLLVVGALVVVGGVALRLRGTR